MEKPLKPFVALDEGWRPKPIDVLSPVSCPGAPVHTGQCDRGRAMRVVGTVDYSDSVATSVAWRIEKYLLLRRAAFSCVRAFFKVQLW